jgi:hypothetical protein
VGPGEDRLHVADARPAADRVLDPDQVVPHLVQAPRRGHLRAVGDVLAVDVPVAPPLAVPVAVEAEVQPGPQVEAGVAERGDRERPVRPVGHHRPQRGGRQAAVVVPHLRLDHQGRERLPPPVGVLDAALELDALPAAEGVALVVEVDAVAAAVRPLAQDR